MSADPRDLERAIGEIRQRLGRIEAKLGMQAGLEGEAAARAAAPVVPGPVVHAAATPVEAPPLNSAPALPPIPTLRPVAPPTAPFAAPPPVPAAPMAPVSSLDRLEELARKRAAAMASRAEQMAPITPPVFARKVEGARPTDGARQDFAWPTRAAMKKVEDSLNLEKMVGGRVAAYIGAIFLVIGLVLGVTYGIKQGWFKFEPAYRCAAVALCGVGLIGLGQFLRKKLGAAGNAVSAGSAAAGIGAMYGAALAAWGMYELYPAAVAFALLAVISAGGVGLGLWWKSLPLGILALLGAYLNPIFLHNEHGHPLVLPTYLVALLAMALTLSAWQPRPFRWLRTVAWWGTVLLGSGGLLAMELASPFIALGFLAVVWAMVHAELVFASGRVPEGAAIGPRPGMLQARLARPLRASFATTVWAVGAGIIVASFTKAHVNLEAWHVAAGGFAGTIGLALMLAGHLRVFTDVPRTDRERLGVALWAEAGALLITTVALGVSDWLQVVTWLAMGVAAIAAGRWARARSLDVYGLIVLSIAVGRLVAYESWQRLGTGHEVLGVVFTWWSLLMAIGGAAWLGAAWLLNRPSPGAETPTRKRRSMVNVAIGMGIALAFAGCMFQGAWIEMVVGLGGAWAMVVMAVSKVRDSAFLRVNGVVVLALSTVAMVMAHVMAMSSMLTGDVATHWQVNIGGLVVTSFSLALLWLTGIWCAMAWGVRGRSVPAGAPWHGSTAMVAIGTGVALLAFLTRGTSAGGVCLAWLGIGAALVAAHAWRRMLALDVIGLATLGITTMAWMFSYVVDHAWLEEKYAAFSHPGLWVALGIAGVMLGAAVWLRGGTPRRATWADGVGTAFVVAGVLLLGSTSLEVSRSAGMLLPSDSHAQAAALTVWWGICAAALLTIGFVMAIPMVRHLGLGLLGVAAVKAVVWDLAGVDLGWRVVSFLGLGVLMMGVAVAYAKLSSRLERHTKAATGEPG